MNKNEGLKILVKLPVKLGDTIMSAYFLRAVKELYPNCQLDVIVTKDLTDILSLLPYVNNYYEYSKKEFSGPLGNIKYGKQISSKENYDLFFCLPFSFSSALAGFFTGSKIRIGYKREHRGFLFTNSIKRPPNLHIVEEFIFLLESYSGKKVELQPLNFQLNIKTKFSFTENRALILNIKSGPPSRSIPINKAISIINSLLLNYSCQIVLTGAPNEMEYISEVKDGFTDETRVLNLAGKTSLLELFYVISKAKCMITTDSGNAHVANVVGTPTVVLFGAAHEHRAKPYDQSISKALKILNMDCVPCESERCKFGDNRCLASIENTAILAAMDELLKIRDQ